MASRTTKRSSTGLVMVGILTLGPSEQPWSFQGVTHWKGFTLVERVALGKSNLPGYDMVSTTILGSMINRQDSCESLGMARLPSWSTFLAHVACASQIQSQL